MPAGTSIFILSLLAYASVTRFLFTLSTCPCTRLFGCSYIDCQSTSDYASVGTFLYVRLCAEPNVTSYTCLKLTYMHACMHGRMGLSTVGSSPECWILERVVGCLLYTSPSPRD